jgi:hypothetical protein
MSFRRRESRIFTEFDESIELKFTLVSNDEVSFSNLFNTSVSGTSILASLNLSAVTAGYALPSADKLKESTNEV